MIEEFIRRSLDDATSQGKLGADAGQVGVDISCSHASFVDAPGDS